MSNVRLWLSVAEVVAVAVITHLLIHYRVIQRAWKRLSTIGRRWKSSLKRRERNLQLVWGNGGVVSNALVGNGCGRDRKTDAFGRVHRIPKGWAKDGAKLSVLVGGLHYEVTVRTNSDGGVLPIVIDRGSPSGAKDDKDPSPAGSPETTT